MMRKQNKNRFFRLSALLVLILALSFTFMACNPPENPDDGDNDTPVTETVLPVKNGNFEYTSSTNYPKTPKNWTFGTGYTLDSKDDVHVYNGVIKVTDDAYTLYSDKYHTSANPGQQGEDGYVLMINNVLDYSASYTSDSITFEKGKYYQLTVYVKTALADGNDSGAYVLLENDGNTREFASFKKVSSADWTAYSFWIEASKSASNTAKLVLANGDGGKTSEDLSKGEVFFDSATLTEKTENEYLSATENATTAKYTFALRNADFTETSNATVADKPVTPYDWTSYVGRDDNGSSIAPTLGLTRGVIDVTTYAPTVGVLTEKDGDTLKYPITKPTASTDNNVLMIYLSNAESPSAYSYYSNAITFEYDKIYKLSFDLRTAGLKDVDGNDTTSKGVTVKLGEEEVLFTNLNTNGEWLTYTTYVYGSATQSKNLSLYFWLGQGHSEDKDEFVSGAAFFDNITLTTKVTDADYTGAIESTTLSKLDLRSDNLNHIAMFDKATDSNNAKLWTGEYTEDHGDATTRKAGVYAIDLDEFDTIKTTLGLTASNPGKATVNRADNDKAIVLANHTANAYFTTLNSTYTIPQNLSYRASFWVKTSGIKSGSGASISLIDKSGEEDSTATTLSAINTETFDKDGNVESNEWKEIVFYVQGNQITSKTVTIKIALGSGNMYNPTYLAGEVYISNFYLEEVTYKEYNSAASGTTIAKHSFRSTESVSINNGNFNNIDVDKSALKPDGSLMGKPGVVQNWTASYTDSSVKTTNEYSGVINKTLYDALATALSLDSARNPFFADENDPSVFNGAPNVLMVYSNKTFGYTSNANSLTAKSYYKISINVKSDGNAKIIMYNGDLATTFASIPATTENNGWATYTYFVKVGLNSSNVKIRLEVESTDSTAHVAFFDNVISESSSKDEYNEAVENATTKKINLNVESFANESTDYPATPSNYTGAVISKAPSGDANVVSGVLNKNHVDLDVAEDFALTASDIDPKTGDNVLVMYNKQDTAYKFTSKAYSFTADTYYKVSLWAKTKSLGEGDSAKITLSLADTTNAVFTFTDTEWKQYTFFVKMDDSTLSNVTLAISLGEYNLDDDDEVITADYAKGYVFVDDIAIEDITEADYTAGISGITDTTTDIKKIDVVAINIENEAEEDDEDPDGSLTGAEGPSAMEIITIVSASLLSVALVAVLVVVFVKKISPRLKEKKNRKYKKPSYDKRTSEVASKDKLDKFKD